MNRETIAVLLLAHGTPNTLGEMPEYLSRVTGGRALPPQVVAELQHRYAQIGLHDQPGEQPPPLTRWTLAQGRQLESALADAGHPLRVYVAMRNWFPLIADVVGQMRADGVTRILALCLAPQNSSTSIGLYRRAVMAAIDAQVAENPSAPKIALNFVESWADEPALIAGFAERLVKLYPRACAEAAAGSLPVLFTAHSVPCRTILSGAEVSGTTGEGKRHGDAGNVGPDPYPNEAKRTAGLVYAAALRQLADLKDWFFAFQSQGVSGGPWLGPTVEETLKALREEGHRGVVLQPIGFLSDHVEILYDIDIAFAERAHSLGLRLFRTESLNDSPQLTEALLNVVLRQLGSG
jgi:ferrochelatase